MKSLPDGAALDAAGLKLRALFRVADLPPEFLGACADECAGFASLLLVGHGGRRLWTAVQMAEIDSPDPIDDFTVTCLRRWLAECLPEVGYRILYPGSGQPALQALGERAGWHHASPFMVGVNASWGSWFAYRAAVLLDAEFAPTPPLSGTSPCLSCSARPCVTACPPGAAGADGFALDACVDWRCRLASPCATSCLARLACPVGAEHRYPTEQIRHSYSRSLAMIRAWAAGG